MATVVLTACSDWTDTESIDLNYQTIDKSENYQAYLENIRAYRSTDHTLVYAWADYPEDAPANQSQRMTSLPDSIDVIVLSTPTTLHATVISDMEAVRTKKGMEVMYNVDFDAIKTDYTAYCETLATQRGAVEDEYNAREDKDNASVAAEYEAALKALADPELSDYLLEKLTESLNFAKKMNFDGVMFAFNGKETTHMRPAELSEYNEQARLFLGAAADWHKRNPSLKYDFLGYPQNIGDASIAAEFRTLFVRQGLDATNSDLYSYYLTLASVDGVPTGKLGMMATYINSDELDTTTGYYSDGTIALDGFCKWLHTADVVAVGIQNVQYDYFDPILSYSHVRAVINAANPVIK